MKEHDMKSVAELRADDDDDDDEFRHNFECVFMSFFMI